MDDATIEVDQPVNADSAPAQKQQRNQSTIKFPYGDLDDAIAVAKGIMSRGGTPCETDQLAAALSQTPTSGNFRMKVATSRVFGLIETVQGKYQLTDLGYEILDEARAADAKARAFLTVPLYRRVYDEFRGKQLPPRPAPLEHAFVGFGVAATQKERARQAFDRSAQQSGFFEHGSRDRLVAPPETTGAGAADSKGSAEQQSGDAGDESGNGRGGTSGGGGSGGSSDLHPFIQGLLDTLPEPETNWAVEGRTKWLQAAAHIFDLMYKGDGSITVKAEQKNQATDYEPVARH